MTGDDARTKAGHGRRGFLKAATLGSAAAVLRPSTLLGQPRSGRSLGEGVGGYGDRSPFETTLRRVRGSRYAQAAGSLTPLQNLNGSITPSALHFERHHSGIPEIDPSEHRLLIDGLVDRPLVFSLAELQRMPAVTRTYFVECSGNGRVKWSPAEPDTDAQAAFGMTSCSEWTGVPVSALLREVGASAGASWVVAEGADACRMTRSVPLDKAMDDTLVAYGQNGEALRPAQGYPLRLLIPGWEGNICVKWLRRLRVVDQSYLTREETAKYTDLMPNGEARQYTFVMDAKSVITRPSGGQQLDEPGFYQISGLAWSGRGRVQRVEVTTDGGRSWAEAQLQDPVLPLAHTRFRFDWSWDGSETTLASRCIDETGDVQPSRAALIAARGTQSSYHNNAVQGWRIGRDGRVENVDV
ncbi:MAG TPA: sulfite dehydrogenase [Acidobacteria bacterium]|nr:sulfite dehydrogenase [Acidobacteriota bacterium]